MDQIYNGIIQMTQNMMRQPRQAAPAQRDTDSFRKLMEKQQAAQTEEAPKQPVEETPQEPFKAAEVSEEPQIQQQMALAAMAVLNNPVVTPQAPEMAQAVEPAVAQAVPTLDMPLQQAVEQAVLPVEQRQAQPLTPEQEAMTVAQAPETAVEPMGDLLDKTEAAVVKAPAQAAAEQAPEAVNGPQDSIKAEQREPETDLDGEQEQSGQMEGAPVFKEVREIPVKVGEAPVAATEQTAKPVETQIGEKLTQALENGETKVEIQLEPENLGRVSVELTWSGDGALRVALHAENSQTRSLLERDSSSLLLALSRHTQEDVQVLVTTRQQEAQQQNLYEDQQGGGHRNPQQEQRHDERRQNGQDFLQQLRLGLIPMDGEAS